MTAVLVRSPVGERPPPERTVVAVVLTRLGRVGLLRRGAGVAHDRGRWHCVTGYTEPGLTAREQVFHELYEETGLGVADLLSFDEGEVLTLTDDRGRPWTVHTYVVSTRERRLRLDDEHDAFRWVTPSAVRRFENRVTWLDDVLRAVGVVTPG